MAELFGDIAVYLYSIDAECLEFVSNICSIMARCHHLFFFLYPPPPVAARVARLLSDPSPPLQAGNGAPMNEGRLHITLKRLGQFPDGAPQEALDLARAVGAEVSDEPFDVSFNRLQGGGQGGRPLVLMPGGHPSATHKLRGFRRGLSDTVHRMGLPAEPAADRFSPHITLDYAHQPMARQTVAPIAWRVTEFFLVISHYGQARHEVLARWPLTARQQEFSDW